VLCEEYQFYFVGPNGVDNGTSNDDWEYQLEEFVPWEEFKANYQ
jgi:hypothetical protein